MATAWERHPPARETATEAKRPRTLIVDDDAGMRRVLARTFSREGHDVTAVASGAEALAAFADRGADLVLLDVELPGGPDGFAICERIRARLDGAEVPVIVLTGRGDADAPMRAFEAGATDFATKGESLTALAQRARFLLRGRRALADLRESEARLQEAQRLAQLATWRYDLATRTLDGGPELWRLVGTARGALPRVAAEDRESLREHMRECLQSGRSSAGELRATGADGEARTLRYRMRLALDEHGEPTALDGVVQDVSSWRRSESRAEFLEHNDPVTRLPNCRSLIARLARAIADAREQNVAAGVIVIGLDAVERVTAALGREAADALLREAAGRIARESQQLAATELQGAPVLARSGTDELALLVPRAGNPAEIAALAQRLLTALEPPLHLPRHEVMLSASAGAAIFPTDGADARELLSAAQRALAQARHGAARVQLHTEASSARALRQFTLGSRLPAALEKGELLLHYQPKLSLGSGEILGFEGLLRWREPELGELQPTEFIPIAEETGLIVPLGEWVVREACRQSAAWRDAGLGAVPIAVNLSAKHFRRAGVAERIAAIVRETGADASSLGIEVTESVLLEDPDLAIRELTALRALGVELALDDFGTGFSSLSYLRRLPVQVLKIDRAFIGEITEREDAAALAASIIALAKALWLRVVAEGVEQPAEQDLLAVWGCEAAQGFLFSRPLPADEAARLWRASRAATATAAAPG